MKNIITILLILLTVLVNIGKVYPYTSYDSWTCVSWRYNLINYPSLSNGSSHTFNKDNSKITVSCRNWSVSINKVPNNYSYSNSSSNSYYTDYYWNYYYRDTYNNNYLRTTSKSSWTINSNYYPSSDPTSYNNYRRVPVVTSNSCDAWTHGWYKHPSLSEWENYQSKSGNHIATLVCFNWIISIKKFSTYFNDSGLYNNIYGDWNYRAFDENYCKPWKILSYKYPFLSNKQTYNLKKNFSWWN